MIDSHRSSLLFTRICFIVIRKNNKYNINSFVNLRYIGTQLIIKAVHGEKYIRHTRGKMTFIFANPNLNLDFPTQRPMQVVATNHKPIKFKVASGAISIESHITDIISKILNV